MFYRAIKFTAFVLGLTLCVTLAFFGAVFMQTRREYQAFKERKKDYEQRLVQLRREVELKEEYLRLAVSDPAFLERIVRRKLGYARPGESIYRFPEKEAPR